MPYGCWYAASTANKFDGRELLAPLWACLGPWGSLTHEWMEQHKDRLIRKTHETYQKDLECNCELPQVSVASYRIACTHIEKDRNEHQPGVECDQRSIFHETILIKQTLLHDPQEVIVETGVDKTNDDL